MSKKVKIVKEELEKILNDDVEVDNFFDDDEVKEYEIFKRQTVATVYNIYLGETVESSTNYYELFNLLNTATQNDHINIHLNNFGGMVHTGVQLINNINTTKANVQIHVEGPVYSMAAILGCCIPNVKVHPFAFYMFHDYSGGERGKGNEIEKSVANYRPFFRNFMHKVCSPFLTKAEIDKVVDGQDLYITAAEATKRFKKINSKKKGK